MTDSHAIVTCPECSQKLRIAAEQYGEQGTCPRCRGGFVTMEVARKGGGTEIAAIRGAEASLLPRMAGYPRGWRCMLDCIIDKRLPLLV